MQYVALFSCMYINKTLIVAGKYIPTFIRLYLLISFIKKEIQSKDIKQADYCTVFISFVTGKVCVFANNLFKTQERRF